MNSITPEPTYLYWNPEIKHLKINFIKPITISQLSNMIESLENLDKNLKFDIEF